MEQRMLSMLDLVGQSNLATMNCMGFGEWSPIKGDKAVLIDCNI